MKEAVYNMAVYFKHDYEDSWITDSYVREMVKDVDQLPVLDSGVDFETDENGRAK